MLGSVQRRSLYPILEDWFGIPYPSQEDQNIPIDSRLSDARSLPDFPVIQYQESLRRPADSNILSISPETSGNLERRALHEIAYEMGVELVAEARQERSLFSPAKRQRILREGLKELLGDIEPEQRISLVNQRQELFPEVCVEAVALESEAGILVPLLLLKPESDSKSLSLVVGLSEGGKARFLINRSSELAGFLRQGVAVCLPDVRGTGETAYSQYNRGDEPALSLSEMGESLLGGRLKDVRTVLKYLRNRPDVDFNQILLWGDSFAPVNKDPIWVDELLGKPVSPQIQHLASPLGAHLALLTALFEPQIQAVAVRGGLVSYLSLLESNFTYVPPDMVVSRILEVADIADMAAALRPVPLYLSAPVTGRNFLASETEMEGSFRLTRQVYGSSAELVLSVGLEDAERDAQRLVEWLNRQARGEL
jgi:hypothetical protein